MNPRLAATVTLCREAAVPALVLVCLAAAGSAGIRSTDAVPIVSRLAPSLAADVNFADKPRPVALSNTDLAIPPVQPMEIAADKQPIAVDQPDIVTASVPVSGTLAEPTPVAHEPEPKPFVVAALTDSSEMLPQQTPPAPTSTATPESADAKSNEAQQPVDSIAILDECLAVDVCVDRYLWALYQRTPKEDTVKIPMQREVTVKRKGKTVTVTRTVTRLADEDFAWKDPKAAENAGKAMVDYVIGGMDRDFKLKLFHLLHAAEEAGLSPGITSAFRDDYRQSIASGLKASNDRSYHGGSFRGGYGHGLAADIVSVNGATRAQRLTSSQTLWNWVDARGTALGIGRPYHDRDPPHVGPIDGTEYVSRNAARIARQARTALKPAARVGNGAAKPVRTARS
jgi:hypothetical protein